MTHLRILTVFGAVAVSAVVLAGCRAEEQGRITQYQPGVYLGKKDTQLSQDQVRALQQLGVRVGALNSSMDQYDRHRTEQALARGDLDLIYVAPERLLTSGFMDLLEHVSIALFAIDEAHCVSQWGHDFRKEYQQLKILHERFPDVPRLALTATADRRTRTEIIDQLDLADADVFVLSFDRPNIH